MDEKKIARINELAKKAKSEEGLTPEEMVERDLLRQGMWPPTGPIWWPSWKTPSL